MAQTKMEFKKEALLRWDQRGAIWRGSSATGEAALLATVNALDARESKRWVALAQLHDPRLLGLLEAKEVSAGRWRLLSAQVKGRSLPVDEEAQAQEQLGQLHKSSGDPNIPFLHQVMVDTQGIYRLLGVPWLQMPEAPLHCLKMAAPSGAPSICDPNLEGEDSVAETLTEPTGLPLLVKLNRGRVKKGGRSSWPRQAGNQRSVLPFLK